MPAGASVATTVNATAPIVAERSMYWPDGAWRDAHNSFGVTELGTKWAFAEGRVGGAAACQTFILRRRLLGGGDQRDGHPPAVTSAAGLERRRQDD